MYNSSHTPAPRSWVWFSPVTVKWIKWIFRACVVSVGVLFLLWTWPVCLALLLGLGLWWKARQASDLGEVIATALFPIIVAFATFAVLLFVLNTLAYTTDLDWLKSVEEGLVQFQIRLEDYTSWSLWVSVSSLLTLVSVSCSALRRQQRPRLFASFQKFAVSTLITLMAMTSFTVFFDIGLEAWISDVVVRRDTALVRQEKEAIAKYLVAETLQRGWTRLDKPDSRDMRQTFRSILEGDEKHARWVAEEHSEGILVIPPVLIFRNSDRLPSPHPRQPSFTRALSSYRRTKQDWQSLSATLAAQEQDTAYAAARAQESLIALTQVFSEIATQIVPHFRRVPERNGFISAYSGALVAQYAESIFMPVVEKWRRDAEISSRSIEARFQSMEVLFPSFNIAKQHLQAVWWKRGIRERELNLRDPNMTSTEAGQVGRQIRERAAKRRRWIAEQERRWKAEREKRWRKADPL